MKIQAFDKIQKANFNEKTKRSILVFLRNYVLFETLEMNSKFEEYCWKFDKSNAMTMLEYIKLEGVEEGMEKGLEKHARITVANLLNKTEFSDDKIAELAEVSINFVQQIKNDQNTNRNS